MAFSVAVSRRRAQRYGPITLIIGVYFAFHTMTMTAIAVIAPSLTEASIAVTIYMGCGLLLDSPAAELAARYGLKPLVGTGGALIVATAGASLILGPGWWIMVLAAVFAMCSSLIYIPTLAKYSELLGPAQAAGQRISVLVQRGGALVASGAIVVALGRGTHAALLLGILFLGAALLISAFILPRSTVRRPPVEQVAVIPSIQYSFAEIAGSQTMVRSAVAAATMPIVFTAAGSVLPLALPDLGAAIGIGLVLRELLAMTASLFLGRGSLRRTNREFAVAAIVAAAGFCVAALVNGPVAVAVGIGFSGPLIGAAIMASTLNARSAAMVSTRPWACFAGMGMAARIGGLAGPVLLGWTLSFGRGGLAAGFAILLVAAACAAIQGKPDRMLQVREG